MDQMRGDLSFRILSGSECRTYRALPRALTIMRMINDRDRVQRLALDSLARGDATGWFEEVYRTADNDPSAVPWADLQVKSPFGHWLARGERLTGRALVVGCGLGDDALALAQRGMQVTAFDVAPTAIDWCRRRFPEAPIDWQVQDLFDLPGAWREAFGFVMESYTLQALPLARRTEAIAAVASTVTRGGRLLVICRARDSGGAVDGPPWPLSREELAEFERHGLIATQFEDFLDEEDPPVRRFRVEYARPA